MNYYYCHTSDTLEITQRWEIDILFLAKSTMYIIYIYIISRKEKKIFIRYLSMRPTANYYSLAIFSVDNITKFSYNILQYICNIYNITNKYYKWSFFHYLFRKSIFQVSSVLILHCFKCSLIVKVEVGVSRGVFSLEWLWSGYLWSYQITTDPLWDQGSYALLISLGTPHLSSLRTF